MSKPKLLLPIAVTVLGVCSHIHTIGSKTLQTRTVTSEENKTHAALFRVGPKNSSWPTGDLGDVTCMRWTGGECGVLACANGIDPVSCIQGFCMCSTGHCANADGTCIPEVGEWLPGSYAIRFRNAYNSKEPYVRSIPFGPEAMNDEVGFAADADGVTQQLEAFGRGEPLWRIAVIPGGFVRFESVHTPGNILTLYDAAKPQRFSLSEKKQRRRSFSMFRRGAIGDDDDTLPVLIRFSAAMADRVSFRIRESIGSSGGLDIWDPQTGLSLASADHWKRPGDGWLYADRVAVSGIAECTARSSPGLEGDCKGREVVDFEPPLPARAITK